ncbi:MAG: DUF58 domain-containing protein [Haloarculaceae archaeon]
MSGSDGSRWRHLQERTIGTPEVAGVTLSRRHVALLVAGTGLLIAGLVGFVSPGILPDVGVSSLVAFVTAIVALGLAGHAGYRRLHRGERGARFPLVETRADVDRPGAAVDEDLRIATASRSLDRTEAVTRGHRARAAVRRHVANVAERVLQHRDRVGETTARTTLERGTWTTDPAAATLFAGGDLDVAGDGTDGSETGVGGVDGPETEASGMDNSETGRGGTDSSETGRGGTDSSETGPETDPASEVSPYPAVDLSGERGLGARITDTLGGGPDFQTAVRHTAASLAAGVPGVEVQGFAEERPRLVPREDAWEPGVWGTEHWRGAGSVGLALLGVAVLAEAPTVLLVAAVFVGYAGYAWLLTPPTPDLGVERALEPTDPVPGEAVRVTVTVRNEGDSLLPDCRLVDRVPDRLAVVGGSARHATALAPGETATFEYDVLAVAGSHEFRDCAVAVRDASGQRERTATVGGEGTTLTCDPAPVTESVPLHPGASNVVGRVSSDVGGSGTGFHAVREYRRGDPLDRIDWNRKARTGDLGTLEFEEEHAATVIVVVDRRPAAALAPGPEARSAVDRSLGGAGQLLDTLLADGDRVGLATVGLDCDYVPPGTGPAQRARMREFLRREETTPVPEAGYSFNPARYRRRLERRLPGDAQVALFSPVCDEPPVTLARWLQARGHGVTVFSPDPTGRDTVGGVLAGIERALDLSSLRAAGIRVVDWSPTEALGTAVERARGRWSV